MSKSLPLLGFPWYFLTSRHQLLADSEGTQRGLRASGGSTLQPQPRRAPRSSVPRSAGNATWLNWTELPFHRRHADKGQHLLFFQDSGPERVSPSYMHMAGGSTQSWWHGRRRDSGSWTTRLHVCPAAMSSGRHAVSTLFPVGQLPLSSVSLEAPALGGDKHCFYFHKPGIASLMCVLVTSCRLSDSTSPNSISSSVKWALKV